MPMAVPVPMMAPPPPWAYATPWQMPPAQQYQQAHPAAAADSCTDRFYAYVRCHSNLTTAGGSDADKSLMRIAMDMSLSQVIDGIVRLLIKQGKLGAENADVEYNLLCPRSGGDSNDSTCKWARCFDEDAWACVRERLRHGFLRGAEPELAIQAASESAAQTVRSRGKSR